MKKHVSHSLEETSSIAHEWLEHVSAAPASDQAVILGLSGHLGSGKTSFTKALARHLGITEEITSPTFVIMKSYPTTHPRWKNLVHIDAYRLESGEELSVIGFDSIAADPANLIIIEWPESVKSALSDPKRYSQISFNADNPDGREERSESVRFITEE